MEGTGSDIIEVSDVPVGIQTVNPLKSNLERYRYINPLKSYAWRNWGKERKNAVRIAASPPEALS